MLKNKDRKADLAVIITFIVLGVVLSISGVGKIICGIYNIINKGFRFGILVEMILIGLFLIVSSIYIIHRSILNREDYRMIKGD